MSEARYGNLADQAARRYGVPPALFRRLISAESSWNPSAASHAGARGLTQVVPRWHPNANLSTPQSQLDYGAKHLGSLLKKYGNARDGLSAYNSGRPWAEGQNIAETRAYVQKILAGSDNSGGATTADPGVGASPAPGSLPAGQLDTRRLLGIMNAARQRALQGQAPGPNYSRELLSLVQGAMSGSTGTHTARSVGQQASSAAQTVAFTMGGGPDAHHSRALGNWQSDDAYDLMGKAGDPVPAYVSGTVTKISGQPGGKPGFAGYGITVRTAQGDLFFKHLGSANVRVGQRITPQTILGTLDAKTAGGPHLHLGGTNRDFLARLARMYVR